MSIFKDRVKVIIFVLVLISIVGCRSETSTSEFKAPSVIPHTPTMTVLITLSPTQTDIPPSPTTTLIPVKPSATPQPIPTFTAQPTLPPDEAIELVLALFENNVNCPLPCWFGVMPGETPWDLAHNYFETFALDIPGSDFGAPPDTVIYSLYHPVPEDLYERGFYTHSFWVKNNRVEFIVAHPLISEAYLVPNLLSTYGPPSNVLIRTFNQTREGYLPFYLALSYPEKGIMAIFLDTDAQVVGKNVRFCLQFEQPTLLLWPPERQYDLADISKFDVSKFNSDEWRQFRQLAEVSDLDISNFTEQFSDPSGRQCIDTPVELWPPPA